MTQPNEPVAPATRTPDAGRWVDAGWDDADEGAFDVLDEEDFQDGDDDFADGPEDSAGLTEEAGAAGPVPGFVDTPAGQPVLAVVGRPNVGKSTLVNRILGSRQAVVQDVPGVTRDRVAYDATWRGRTFTVVDTGGWEARARGLSAQIAEQAKMAVELADAVLFVVDARVGATDEDEAVARVLRRQGKSSVGQLTYDKHQEDIRSVTAGVVGVRPIDWQNRPTFQQVVAFRKHRAR